MIHLYEINRAGVDLYIMIRENDTDTFMLLTFRSFLANTPDLIFIKDSNLNYIFASQAFANMVGHQHVNDLAGKSDFDIFEPELAKRYTQDDRRILETGIPMKDHIEPIPDQDGRKSYSSTSKYLIKNPDGKVIGIYGVARDVTAQVQLAEERENRKLSRQMFEGVIEADLTLDQLLLAEGSSLSHCMLKAVSFTEAMEFLAAHMVHNDYAEAFLNFFDIRVLMNLYRDGKKDFSHLTCLSVNQTDYKWIEFKARLYFSKITNTLRITIVLNDLDEEIRDKERLKIKSEIDPLTGLYNRESTISRIMECIKDSGALHNHALLFIDLDHFKQVNDQLGHPFGDTVLQKIAEMLKLLFRKDDVIGRIGGDEFLILLKNVSSQEDAKKRASMIFQTVPLYQVEQEKELFITCSVGGAMYQGDGKSFETLYREADQALYCAKKKGRNTIVFYEP